MNALALSATILLFNKLTDHSKKERKIYDLALERLQWVRGKWNQDRSKCIDFDNRRPPEKNEEKHTSVALMKQYLITMEHLRNK